MMKKYFNSFLFFSLLFASAVASAAVSAPQDIQISDLAQYANGDNLEGVTAGFNSSQAGMTLLIIAGVFIAISFLANAGK